MGQALQRPPATALTTPTADGQPCDGVRHRAKLGTAPRVWTTPRRLHRRYQLWVKRYNGLGANTDDARSAAVSPDGKTVYVTGQSWGGQASTWDYATVAYDAASGAQRWVKRYNGPGNAYDLASSVAASPSSGTVYVTGQSAGTSTGADYATIAYNAASGQMGGRYNGTGNGTDITPRWRSAPPAGRCTSLEKALRPADSMTTPRSFTPPDPAMGQRPPGR